LPTRTHEADKKAFETILEHSKKPQEEL